MTLILIVDDIEQNLYMLKVLLEGHGYDVETAVNGIDALEKAHAAPPDMIVSDILMPGMDGFTLCRQWKSDDQLSHIPFIFYTATYTTPQDKEFALSLGADQFLLKPLEPDEFLAALKNAEEKPAAESVQPLTTATVEETTYFKQYNETLIRKLEQKMMDLERANQRLQILYQVSTKLAAIKPLDELIIQTLRTVVEIVGYEDAGFFAYDEDSESFSMQAAVGRTPEELVRMREELRFSLGEERGLVGLCGQTRKPIIINDTQLDSRWIPIDSDSQSALFVPVIYEELLIGVIGFLRAERGMFTEEDARNALILANNIAIAIVNSRLYETQQQYTNRLEVEVAARTSELTIALEKAQEADRLKSQFISDVNHELRTPLSNIQLYLNLLERGSQKDQSRYMAVLNQEAARLQHLIEDMLDLSSLDANKTAANLEPIDLNGLIKTLVFEREKLVTDNGLTLAFAANDTIPSVLADPQLLFQVLTNVLINAMHYTKSGGSITLSTDAVQKDGQNWVTVSVADTGSGISEEELAHIFERFYRGQAGREHRSSGTGLGLAICKEIIDRHGGSIEVQSVVDEGSNFTVYLQAAE